MNKIMDSQENINKIRNAILSHWDLEGHHNVADIRYVTEIDRTENKLLITGVRINNIYLTCQQITAITGIQFA